VPDPEGKAAFAPDDTAAASGREGAVAAVPNGEVEVTWPVPAASRVPPLPEFRLRSHQTTAMITTMTMTQIIHSIAKPFCPKREVAVA
jgi:hypothetical protein